VLGDLLAELGNPLARTPLLAEAGNSKEPTEITALQNDPEQHQPDAKNMMCFVSRTPDLNPDSDSARKAPRKAPQKSGIG
jgi:hypothetical protein